MCLVSLVIPFYYVFRSALLLVMKGFFFKITLLYLYFVSLTHSYPVNMYNIVVLNVKHRMCLYTLK